MRIPKWARKEQTAVVHSGNVYSNVAKLLEIEASYHRRLGNNSGARALVMAAQALREVATGSFSPAVAFGWDEEQS